MHTWNWNNYLWSFQPALRYLRALWWCSHHRPLLHCNVCATVPHFQWWRVEHSGTVPEKPSMDQKGDCQIPKCFSTGAKLHIQACHTGYCLCIRWVYREHLAWHQWCSSPSVSYCPPVWPRCPIIYHQQSALVHQEVLSGLSSHHKAQNYWFWYRQPDQMLSTCHCWTPEPPGLWYWSECFAT